MKQMGSQLKNMLTLALHRACAEVAASDAISAADSRNKSIGKLMRAMASTGKPRKARRTARENTGHQRKAKANKRKPRTATTSTRKQP